MWRGIFGQICQKYWQICLWQKQLVQYMRLWAWHFLLLRCFTVRWSSDRTAFWHVLWGGSFGPCYCVGPHLESRSLQQMALAKLAHSRNPQMNWVGLRVLRDWYIVYHFNETYLVKLHAQLRICQYFIYLFVVYRRTVAQTIQLRSTLVNITVSNKPFEAWWLLYVPSVLILTILHFACTVPLCVPFDFHNMQLSFFYIIFTDCFLFPERKDAVSSVTVELNL
jgi:hypothetical protein